MPPYCKRRRVPGAAYGRKGRRPPAPPEQIDEVHEAPLPPACPDCCGGPAEQTHVAPPYQLGAAAAQPGPDAHAAVKGPISRR